MSGQISKKMPVLDGWELTLIQLYAQCAKEDGVSISDLRILFDALDINNDQIFYEASVVLSRVFHYMRE